MKQFMLRKERIKKENMNLKKINHISFLNRKNLETRIYNEIKDQSVNALKIIRHRAKNRYEISLRKENKKSKIISIQKLIKI